MEVDAREERVGRVRVDVRVVLEVHLLDDLEAIRMVRGARHDARQADLAKFLGREREFALRHQILGKLPDAGAVAAEHVEEKALEARGARDVSGGRGRCNRLARGLRRVATRAKEFVHSVVFVRADDEAHDRKSHLLGDPARVRIAEVAARHREDDLLAHAFDGPQIAVEVVDDLRHDASPEDGVDRAEAVGLRVLAILEDRAHDVLAFVERAVDLDVDDVRILIGIKLRRLELAHAVLRGKHDDLDVLVPAERGLGRSPHVARRGAEQRARAPLGERRVEEPRHELQGNVVEGKRRTVRKLEQADLVVEPLHGRDLLGREHTAGVAEVAGLIGFGADLPEILLRELLGEEADDLEGERGIGEAAPRHQGVGVDLREHRRHVEAAILGIALEENVAEREARFEASGGNVLH